MRGPESKVTYTPESQTLQAIRAELRALEIENTRLRSSNNGLMETLEEWRVLAGIKQSQVVDSMSDPNTVAITVFRVRVINGGYQAVRLAVIVDMLNRPEVLAAIDEDGHEVGLTSEERIVALCHAQGGWFKPDLHT